MANKIDFYLYGVKCASSSLEEIADRAFEIMKAYGPRAKYEFELGVASSISEYAYSDTEDDYTIDLDRIGGTLDFESENLRNNSYFNGIGVSRKYIPGPEGTMRYNVPKTR